MRFLPGCFAAASLVAFSAEPCFAQADAPARDAEADTKPALPPVASQPPPEQAQGSPELQPAPEAPKSQPPPPEQTRPGPVVRPVAKPRTIRVQKAEPEHKDELTEAGYVPGYRRDLSVGMTPFVPDVGGLPGGMTPGFAAPMPSNDWSFKWSGYMSISLQDSSRRRHGPLVPGQKRMVFHAPPATIDEWYAFVSTNTVPGNWVGMNFTYGNRLVTATVFVSTWNLTDPSTYYQIGPNQYVNNASLTFTPEPIGDFRFRADVGFLTVSYGALGRYGPGMYVNPIIGYMRAAGEVINIQRDLSDTLLVFLEHGIAGPRTGSVPVEATSVQPADNSLWPASWVHHAHLGLIQKGDPGIRLNLHYVSNWSQDDTRRFAVDNTKTQAVDETRLKDGRLDVYGFDGHLETNTWGSLGIGGAYIRGHNAYTLKGFSTWAGDGEQLTDRWWGPQSGGNGELYVLGVNYGVSLGKIVSYPLPFAGDAPDIVINAGFSLGAATTRFKPLDDKVRLKWGADALYTILRYVGIGARVDQVIPNAGDGRETFWVLAPRLQFKSDWNSRETISLRYAKWFYGSRTHSDLLGARRIDRLDDQLFALNFNLGW